MTSKPIKLKTMTEQPFQPGDILEFIRRNHPCLQQGVQYICSTCKVFAGTEWAVGIEGVDNGKAIWAPEAFRKLHIDTKAGDIESYQTEDYG